MVLSMSKELLKRYITEVLMNIDQDDAMNQNVIWKDSKGTGKLTIRKIVTYTKPFSRFAPGDDVDAELNSDGTITVNGVEKWKPEFDKSKTTPRLRRVKRRRRLA
jgi:hypothetical protein